VGPAQWCRECEPVTQHSHSHVFPSASTALSGWGDEGFFSFCEFKSLWVLGSFGEFWG